MAVLVFPSWGEIMGGIICNRFVSQLTWKQEDFHGGLGKCPSLNKTGSRLDEEF